eukprot:TRINITY_DN2084_c0_g1_i2.p1 TRINITY_DN2084_c0_g1~~TRINITY_DN2084_c0_g1_i2.p1  ORF type:complete len:973 (-),score=386.37 TRINITY_DN2084_c0_g1_i2:100-3018(-)
MILVCNSLRNDLNHPNEYLRGGTLRLVCRLKDMEILEPLLPSVRANLENKNAYVRRNAIFAVYTVFKVLPILIPDGPEIIYEYLCEETDQACKRNAFIMLCEVASKKAIEFLGSCIDQISQFDENLQFVILDLIKKLCARVPSEKQKYIKSVFELLESPTLSVQYEAAATLLVLSSFPTAVKAAASTYIRIIQIHHDNNVRMIVLDRLLEIKKRHHKVMQDLMLELTKTLSAPNLDIKKKTLDIVLDLVSPKNIDQLILVLKKEINKTQSEEEDSAMDYRQMLISAIHKCAIKYPEIASNVVSLLIEFIGDSNSKIASDVAYFIRDVMQKYPSLRPLLLANLYDSFSSIQSSSVLRVVVWILGEYSLTPEHIDSTFNLLFSHLGEPPFNSSTATITTSTPNPTATPTSTLPSNNTNKNTEKKEGRVILEDGTYQTTSALMQNDKKKKEEVDEIGGNSELGETSTLRLKLREFIVKGHFFLGNVIAQTLTKLVLRVKQQNSLEEIVFNGLRAKVILYIVSIMQYGLSQNYSSLSQSSLTPPSTTTNIVLENNTNSKEKESKGTGNSGNKMKEMSLDSYSRYSVCLNLLMNEYTNPLSSSIFVSQSSLSFDHLLTLSLQEDDEDDFSDFASLSSPPTKENVNPNKNEQEVKGLSLSSVKKNNKNFNLFNGKRNKRGGEVDELIQIRQLVDGMASRKIKGQLEMEMVEDLNKASGFEEENKEKTLSQKLERLVQLTGFSDPVYCEAFVNVHQYDILLEVTVVNQTSDTLQTLTLELSTIGDLKLVERPNPVTLQAQESKLIKANIKVSSTETGIIFGNIVYDISTTNYSADRNCVILNEIRIDIMDYMSPLKKCDQQQFRKMWTEFEWENKVSVSTSITDVRQFLDHILKCTNMRCLTPKSSISGDSKFLAANLYAQSVFGEDALANISVEQTNEGKIVGYIRIRSKTQGIALSIGDKITVKQKGTDQTSSQSIL